MQTGTAAPQVALEIDSVSPEFARQDAISRLSRDLMLGVDGMRMAGPAYVERGEGESEAQYQTRLRRPALLNSYRKTLDFLRGQVFQQDAGLEGDLAEAFADFAEDVDRCGDSLTTWGASVFTAGLRDGVTFCLADYSDVQVRTEEGSGLLQFLDGDGEWRAKTVQADEENGWGPYLVHVPVSDVLDMWTESRDGREVVTHFRYMERGLEPSPLSEWSRQEVLRIHAWWPDRWEVYVKHANEAGYTLEREGANQLGYIPVSTFMPGEQIGPKTARPALDDLAQLNRRHWAASCGHCELLEYVRRPVWFGRMLGRIRNADGTESDVVVGAGRMIASEDPQADLKSVGVDSGSVAASSAELETLKQEMALYGLQMLEPSKGAVTATEVEKEARESNSTLAAWAVAFKDFLENAMLDVARWKGLDDGPSVFVNTVFSKAAKDDYLLELYRAGAISHESLLTLLKTCGTLPDDFDVEGETARMARGTLLNGSSFGVQSLSSALQGTAKE